MLYRQFFVGGDISHENQWESKQLKKKKHMPAVKFSRSNLFKKKGVALTSLQPFFSVVPDFARLSPIEF